MKRLVSILLLGSILFSYVCVGAEPVQDNYEFILPVEFSEIRHEIYDIYVAKKGDSYAAYDSSGKKISADYDSIGQYEDWFAIARKGEKVYRINHYGMEYNFVVPGNVLDVYDSVSIVDISQNNDGRPLMYYEGEFGLYESGGELIAKAPYSKFLCRNNYACLTFFNGMMLFFEDDKVGAVNTKLEEVIPAIYEDLQLSENDWNIVAKRDGKYGVLNNEGHTVLDFKYEYIKSLYDGYDIYYVIKENGLFGLANRQGAVVMEPSLKYEPQSVYPDNRLVIVEKPNTRNDKDEYGLLYGVVDFDGNEVLPMEHIQIVDISEGRIAAKKAYDHGGYYDVCGNEITSFDYRMISGYNEGLAFASRYNADGSWNHHVMNLKGEVVFEPQNWSNGYRDGIACVDRETIIDSKGNCLVNLKDSGLEISGDYWWDGLKTGYFRVTDGTNYGIIKVDLPEDEPIWDYEYIDYGNVKSLEKWQNGYSFTLETGEVKYIDSFGNETEDEALVKGYTDAEDGLLNKLKAEYGENKAFPFGVGRYVAYENNKCHIMNDKGEMIKTLNGEPTIFMGAEEYILLTNGTKNEILDSNFNSLITLRDVVVSFIYENGLVKIHDNKTAKYKIINLDEKIIAESIGDIFYIGEGLFDVRDSYGSQLINSDGRVIAANYRYVTNVGDNGYIGISTNSFEGYINTDGDYVLALPEGWHIQGAFSEGLASVVKDLVYRPYGEIKYITETGETALLRNDKSGYKWSIGDEFKNGITMVGRGVGKAGPASYNVLRCLYDEPSDWARETVDEAKALGLLPEELQSRYRKNITRENFCKLVYELPFVKSMERLPAENVNYVDCDDEKVKFLSEVGIIYGVGQNRFAPDEYLTREQAAEILFRIWVKLGNIPDYTEEKFADHNEISDWATGVPYAMKNAGIMNGVGDNRFAPQEGYSTEQAIATTLRLYNISLKNS